jgi:glucan phosphorylase
MRIAPSVTASAGEENFSLFGLNAEQVEGSRGWYNPRWHYENEPETRAALDLIARNHFSRNEPGIFRPSSMPCCNTANCIICRYTGLACLFASLPKSVFPYIAF